MKNLFVFDIDGTCVKPSSGNTFPITPEDMMPLFNPRGLYRRDSIIGYASNQKGISLGIIDQDFWEARMTKFRNLGFLGDILYCPDEGQSLRYLAHFSDENIIDIDLDNKEDIWELYPSVYDCIRFGHTGQDNDYFFRKPNPGMLVWYRLKYPRCNNYIFIGDMESDREAAIKAGWQYLMIDEFLEKNPELVISD
jgi:hypothetical protein